MNKLYHISDLKSRLKLMNNPDYMFCLSYCSVSTCQEFSWAGGHYCRFHHPERADCEKKLIAELADTRKKLWVNKDFSFLRIENLNLEGEKFQSCRFTGSYFRGSLLDKTSFNDCIMDMLNAGNCSFTACAMTNVILSGSLLDSSDFRDSDLISVNFIGVKANQAIFDGSDLSFSRFARAELNGASFRDCNLVAVDFTGVDRDSVNFMDSNPAACFCGEKNVHFNSNF